MKIRDKSKIIGRVRIYSRDAHTGEIVEERTHTNLVVDGGLNALAELLGGSSTKHITDVTWGESATAPAAGDTAPLLNNLDKPINFSTPTANELYLEATMGTGDGNGQTFEEVGTLCDDGTLFSRVLSGPWVKHSGISLTVEWTFEFTV